MYVYIRDLKLVRPVTLSFLSPIYTCKADSDPLILHLVQAYHITIYLCIYSATYISQCTQPTEIRRSHSILMLCKHFVDTYNCAVTIKLNLIYSNLL